MAVKYGSLNSDTGYTGLSTDVKPIVDSGKEFYEVDTGDVYIFDGTSWYLRIDGDNTNKHAASIDSNGRQNFNSIFGDKYMCMRKPKFSVNFNYAQDDRQVLAATLNGGTVAKVVNLSTINTGVNTNGYASVQTRQSLRYSAGRDAETFFTGMFTTPKANSFQRVGLFDTNDGFYIGFEGVNFGITVRKSTSNTFITQNNFNADKLDGTGKSGFLLDHTKLNIYRINYGYLGVAPIFYEVYAGYNIGWIAFHIYDISNKQNGTHIGKPYLPVKAEVGNTGNNTNMTFSSGSIYAGVIDGSGAPDESSREFSYARTIANAAASASATPIAIFHNKATYGGVENKIENLLLRVGVGVEGTKTSALRLYRVFGATPTGTSFSDISSNSNMEISTAGAFNLAGCELLYSWALGKSGQIDIDTERLNFLLLPDQYAVFTYTSTASSDFEFSCRWSELF